MDERTTEVEMDLKGAEKHFVSIFMNVPGLPAIQVMVKAPREFIASEYEKAREENDDLFLRGDDGRGGTIDIYVHASYIAGIIIGNPPSGVLAPAGPHRGPVRNIQ